MHATLELSELDTKIGQLFMAGMPGTSVDTGTEQLIKRYGLGGIIFFSRNIEDPIQLAELCKTLQNMSMEFQGYPLFLAVDQEGGKVSRLVEGFTRFPGNEVIGTGQDPVKEASKFARITSQEMRLVGLNMNLAPVLDVHRGKPEQHLKGRTFGRDPKVVADLGRVIIQETQKTGIMAVAKHFPGLGAATNDPHVTGLVINETLDGLERIDLLPFERAIACGVVGVMSSHACYPVLDPDWPATMSYQIMTRLLREKLGHTGLALTDDLEMGAIREKWSVGEGACKAFEAGADVLLICEDQDQVLESIAEIRSGLLQGRLKLERLYMSLSRIKKVKSRFLKKPVIFSLDQIKDYFCS